MTPRAKPAEPALLIPQAMVDPDDLHDHPLNYRRHADEAITESLDGFGLVSPITVNKRDMTVLSGHGVKDNWKRTHPGEAIQVSLVDLDPKRATKLVVAMNRSHDLGHDDEQALYAILHSLDDDLDMTGFDADDVEAMRSDLTIRDEETRDGPTLDPRGDKFTFDDMHRSGTRIMVLEFELDAFKWAQGHLAAIAAEEKVETNVDVVVRLIAARVGEQPPPTITTAERAAIDDATEDDGAPF